eukprot:7840858-Pyramimonas_sp.AAC.1
MCECVSDQELPEVWPEVSEDMLDVINVLQGAALVEVRQAADGQLRCCLTSRALTSGRVISFWRLSKPRCALALRDVPA